MMEEGTTPEFLQLLREVIWVYKHLPIFVSLLGLDIGIMFLLRAVVYMRVRKVRLKGPMCFGCLMLRLPGPSELILLCCIASWIWVVVRVKVCMSSL